ncbi:hypothetical protein ILUMI_23612, partial [Ignelater luminosus]
MIFQHDEASHFSQRTRQHLDDSFANKWSGHGGPTLSDKDRSECGVEFLRFKDSRDNFFWSHIDDTDEHAYYIATRAHLLAHAVFIKIGPTSETEAELDEILYNVDKSVIYAFALNECRKIKEKMEHQLQQLKERGSTSQLWVQYIQMVTLVKIFISSERMGNWDQHLETVWQMLPYSHARPLQLHELLEELENVNHIPEPPDTIILFSPDNANDCLIDKDSGEEDIVTINNLLGSQLRNVEVVTGYSDTKFEAVLPVAEVVSTPEQDNSDFESEDELPLSRFVTSKAKRGTYDYVLEKDRELLFCKWNDDNAVTIASNALSVNPVGRVKRYLQKENQIIYIDQPNLVKNFNHHMGGVDRSDQNIRGRK